MKVKAHKLIGNDGAAVSFKRTPNQSGVIEPRFLVMHYTAGSSASSSISWLTNREAKASAHLVIGRDGSITQLADFNRKTWHAGKSSWRGFNGLNSYSIGIELDNPGILKGSPGRWRTVTGALVADGEVIETLHDGKLVGWHTYTEAQLDAAREACVTLVRHYGLEGVVGHEDIAPGRKNDPGPAFPMASFQSLADGRDNDQGEDVWLTTAALNIRGGPGTEHGKLAEVSPLPKGTRLAVLVADGIWRKVDVLDIVNGEMDIVGWVHSRYIEPEPT